MSEIEFKAVPAEDSRHESRASLIGVVGLTSLVEGETFLGVSNVAGV